MLQLVTYNVRTNNAYNMIYNIMQETILYHTGDDVMHDAKKKMHDQNYAHNMRCQKKVWLLVIGEATLPK